MDRSLGAVMAIAKRHLPPWSTDMVVLSPGALTPSAQAVLGRAHWRARDSNRSVARDDVWHALKETNADRFAYLLQLIDATNSD